VPTKKTTLIIMTAAGILLAAYLLLYTKEPKGFVFHKGDRTSYSYEMHSVIRYGNEDSFKNLDTEISGVLSTKVLDTSEDVTLAISFSPEKIKYDINPEIEKYLSLPFSVKMEKYGKIISFNTPEGLDEETAYLLKALIHPLETILSTAGMKEYSRKSSDNLGPFTAHYEIKGQNITKSKVKYIDLESDNIDTPTVKIIQSRHNAVKDTSGWLNELKGSEHLIIDDKPFYMTEVKTDINLQKLSGAVAKSPAWDIEKVSDISIIPLPAKKPEKIIRISAKEETEPKHSTSERTNSKELSDYLLNSKKLYISTLTEYLSANENQLDEVMDIINNPNVPANTVSILLSSLGTLGTEKAQRLLLSVAENDGLDDNVRFQAVMAFSQLNMPPTDSVLEFLLSGTDKFGQVGIQRDIGSTSILAAGVIIENISADYPQEAEEINEKLIRLLEQYSDEYVRGVLILSLGNTKNVENASAIASNFSSEKFTVRIATADALEKIPGDTAKTALAEQLAKENIPNVSISILKSLNKNELGQNELQAVANQLLSSGLPSVRHSAILLLSDHKETAPELVETTFKKALRSETSRENAKLMIKGYAK